MALDINYKLQLKRNESIFETREAALTGIKTQLTNADEGEVRIAIFKNGEVENIFLGIKGFSGYQIFEGVVIGKDGTIHVPQTTQEALDSLQQLANALQIEEVTDDKEGNNKRYKLVGIGGEQLGAFIDIPFDEAFEVSFEPTGTEDSDLKSTNVQDVIEELHQVVLEDEEVVAQGFSAFRRVLGVSEDVELDLTGTTYLADCTEIANALKILDSKIKAIDNIDTIDCGVY